jgi:predicted DNA-binding transcriptional regulator AlpA
VPGRGDHHHRANSKDPRQQDQSTRRLAEIHRSKSPCSCQSGINFPTPRVWLLRLRRVSKCLGMSRSSSCGSSRRSSSTTSLPPCVRVPRHVARLITRLVIDFFASRKLVVDYFTYASRPVALARRAACRVTHRRLLRLVPAHRRLLRLRHAPGCLGTSRGSSRGSSSTTSPRAGSSSTTSTTPRVRVLRHAARLVINYSASRRLVVDYSASRRLVVYYFTSRRLVVDYFYYTSRPGALACRTAHHAAHHRLLRLAQARRRLLRLTQAHHRLLRLRRMSGCLGTSRGSSRGSSSTTSPTPHVRVPRHVARLVTRPVIDYFTYVARPVSLARRATCRVTHRRLLRRAQARRRLLRLRRTSGCLGTSRGSSRGSSSTTWPTPRVLVPQLIARLVTRLVAPLVANYFAYAARSGASARRAARLTARRRLLRLRRASGCLGTLRGSSRGSSSTTRCAVTSSCGHTGSTSATPCVVTTCLAATLALLRVRHAQPRRCLPVASRRPFILTSFPNYSRIAVTPPTTSRNQL